MTRAAPTCVAALAALALSGCASASYGGTSGSQIKAANVTTTLPPTVAGLQVKQEALPKAFKKISHSYIDGATFYSLRKETNVQGTLEIAHFAKVAPLSSSAFRNQVEGDVLVGGVPTKVLIVGIAVQQTTGLKSIVSEWIVGDQLFVLTVLESYPMGRGLLDGVVAAVTT